jgi:hypothetical protein
MSNLLSHPLGIFAVSVVALSFAALIGDFFGKRWRPDPGEFTTILAATFTLLSLMIGFSFAIAINRYHQRKTLEEGEANAIGTAYLRAELLPAEAAATVRNVLKKYLDQRVLFYRIRNPVELNRINAEATTLQAELWSAVVHSAAEQPTPPIALVVSGMNDVLNSQDTRRLHGGIVSLMKHADGNSLILWQPAIWLCPTTNQQCRPLRVADACVVFICFDRRH